MRIQYAGRVYDKREINALKQAADEFWLTHGHFCDKFQEQFRLYVGTDYCLAVNSGSSANLLAFSALTSNRLGKRRIERGDEIITTAACFPTTISPIVQYGAIPIFVDITIPQYNIDITCLEAALSKKTKAVVLGHTLGNPFDIQALISFCANNNLWLIEDCADALGSTYTLYKDPVAHQVGSFGDISTFSFYPAHQITTGEGGSVCTSNDMLASILTSMRDWGRDCTCHSGQDNSCGKRFLGQHGTLPHGYDHKYVYSEFGYNMKMTEMQGAIGTIQLEKLSFFRLARITNWKRLKESLEDMEELFYLPEPEIGSDPCWFGFLLVIKNPDIVDRRKLQVYLENEGIQTRLLFAGNIVRQPCFEHLIAGKDYKIVGLLPNTDKVMADGLWLGVYPGIKPHEIDYMVDTIRRFVNERIHTNNRSNGICRKSPGKTSR